MPKAVKPTKTPSNRRKPPFQPSPVGEQKNYSLQPGNEYRLWRCGTIAWKESTRDFEARVILEHIATENHVVIFSNHPSYADAEFLIQRISESLDGKGPRLVYNVFAETTGHDIGSVGPGKTPHMTYAKALIWSYIILETSA